MIAGFTGTRYGLTEVQQEVLHDYLHVALPAEFHHGDGGEGDAMAVTIAQGLGIPTFAHPGLMAKWRAHTINNAVTYLPKPELERDRDIAIICDVLFACPQGFTEVKRSGTWTTMRYATAEKKRVITIYPDGTFSG